MSEFRKKLMMAYAANLGRGDIVYPGLIAAWSAAGKSNDDADRATLRDLTGNGHDITLNGFAFSEMSGYGGYKDYFDQYGGLINQVNSKNKIVISGDYRANQVIGSKYNTVSKLEKILRLKISNFPKEFNSAGLIWEYGYIYTDGTRNVYTKTLKENGTYEIDVSNIVLDENKTLKEVYSYRLRFVLDEVLENFTVELLPEYPDALVFDGVDDYGINENMPILTDYTIIAKRGNCSGGCLITKGLATNGSFILEGYEFINNTYNFGYGQNKNIDKNNPITWQTKLSYNEQNLILGNVTEISNLFIIGRLSKTDQRYLNGAFYSAYLFDRSLDEQEIKAFIRKYIDPEYLLPSEIPTPDCYYDFSQGSNDDENRDTIVDYSGNGNDAVAYGFAWSGMSGYGGYSTNFKDWTNNNTQAIFTKTSNKIHVTEVLSISGFIYKSNVDNTKDYKLRFKITGLNGKNGNFGESNNKLEFNSDGEYIYEVPANTYDAPYSVAFRFGFKDECDITIELLPEYEGALVFDGVDDYVNLDAFDSGFKTMFMVCNPLALNRIMYDQREEAQTIYDFALYNTDTELNKIAYNARNINGTYINGKYNNNIENSKLISKKQLITVKSKLFQLSTPIIGCGYNKTNFANMALYKFLGFKEELTEEQINAVIKKYNLLDGVDEIEVS